MCGIFGYTGTHTAAPILVDGLRTLEYRGYDSAGIFTPLGGAVRSVGAIDNLASKLQEDMPGTSGISHTRWATHGEPTEKNAHPHVDASGRVWVVHNGIIENFREIKDMLAAQGYEFQSDTDTEVLTYFIGTLYDGRNLEGAVRQALAHVRGTYGIAVMDKEEPDTIVVARLGSPIVLGIGEHGNFVSSDPSALMTHTKDVIYLEDGEMAVLTNSTYKVHTIKGERKEKQPETIEWDVESAQKGGFEHFMLKEIMETPEVVQNTLRGRLVASQGRVKLGGIEGVINKLREISRLTIVGCGSAFYAGNIGKYFIEEYAGIPVNVELGSEYRYKRNIPDHKEAVLAISQSGETADTLASVREAKKLNLLTLGIINSVGSTIARETDAGVYNHAGPEIGVASTKAFVSQLVVLILYTLALGRDRQMDREAGIEIAQALESLPEALSAVLKERETIKKIAKKYIEYRDFLFIGRKFNLPLAYEGALKLKEVSYVHAEGYGSGEMKHGPIAMIDESFPTIAILPDDEVYEKNISNIEEIKARKGPVIAFATAGDESVKSLVDNVVYLPKVHPIVQPIVATVGLHLFAYYFGVEKGYNVDRPRNLAKSVTVE